MTDQMTHEQERALPWTRLTKMIREYIDDYHLEGDEGSYTPTRRERFIAEDIINSMLVDDDMAAAIRAALGRPADTDMTPEQALTRMFERLDAIDGNFEWTQERDIIRAALSRPAVPAVPAELVELLDRLSPPGHGIAMKGDPTEAFHTGHDVYLAQRVKAWLRNPTPAPAVPEGVIRDAASHLTNWLDMNWCECEGGHTCGRNNVVRTRDQLLQLLAAAPAEESSGVGCYDCGLQYGGASWIEAVIPDKAWNLIRPEGAAEGCGILCISCIARRLREHGIEHCPVWLCGTEPLRGAGAAQRRRRQRMSRLEHLRHVHGRLETALTETQQTYYATRAHIARNGDLPCTELGPIERALVETCRAIECVESELRIAARQEPEQAPVKKSLTTARAERVLAKHQPCGCVICDCEDDRQCQGCGAKSCGTHPVQEIPNPVYVEQEQPEDGPVAWMVDYGDGSDPEVYEGKRPPGVAVECSVAPLYPESVKAERDALHAENAELRERVKELEADAAMLDQMQDECWNVECEAYPIADSGDSDIEWRVFSSHMAEPRRREIGYGRTPREALNAAMQERKS